MKFALKPAALAASLSLLCLLPVLPGQALAAAKPMSTALAVDQGLANPGDSVDVAIMLSAVNQDDLKAFVASTVDPSSPNFRKYITPAQFAARYGQSAATVQQVSSYLQANGLTVTQVFNNNLVIMARGTNAQLTQLFSAPIHAFALNGNTFQKPTGAVIVPAAIQSVVSSVIGLNTQARYRPHLRTAIELPASATVAATSTGNATPAAAPTFGQPGTYTVNDLATYNNIKPLYTAGVTGAGRTLGIMTFASFRATDPPAYWTAVGVNHTGTVTAVNASGTTISATGADETTLDIEQSGGLAPGANIIVYEAANSAAGEIALYTKAITDNIADSLSISWGEAEVFYEPSDLTALNTLFMQSAAQGVPISASTGDAGAYDVNGEGFLYPNYAPVLSVDFPAVSPYIVAAGGTTLPFTLALTHGTVTVPNERAWGWDYLQNYILSYQTNAYYFANLWPAGDGGGVSLQYPVPDYQVGLPGVKTSLPGQALFCYVTTANSSTVQGCTAGDYFTVDTASATGSMMWASGFAGRNLPDVSLNADPESGYALYYKGAWSTGNGGTSFVAPQLNGIFTLLTAKAGYRLGWVHPTMYAAFRTQGYGSGSPFRAITDGTNMYWKSTNSYNPATGIGSLDVANLAALFPPAPAATPTASLAKARK